MKGPKMSTELKIQTVLGLIRRTPDIRVSHKYKKLSSMPGAQIRSVGIYTFKGYDGQIIVGFDCNGYSHHRETAGEQLSKFQSFAISQGLQVKKAQWSKSELVITRVN